MTDNIENNIEAAIARALERRTGPVVPPDFAARVRQSLPPQRAARARVPVGRIAAIVAAVALTVALFLLAPRATPNFDSLSFDVELLMLAELAAIAYWLTARTGIRS